MNDTDSQLVGRGSADTVNAAGFTSQITAGFRAVELQHIENPIIIDPLAPYLAGAVMHKQHYQTAFLGRLVIVQEAIS
jgi:hypothetical protein